jgi:hypothetical protein
MANVTISKGALAALVGGLVGCLMALAFVAGRQSTPAGTGVPPVAATDPIDAPLPAAGAEPTGAAPETAAPPSEGAPASVSGPMPSRASDGPATAGAEPKPEAPLDAGQRSAVVRYFQEVDALQASVGGGTDPEAAARAIVAQLGSGDTRALDDLLATQRKALDALRAITPPEPCREYHARLIATTTSGGDMAGEMRTAVTRGDMGSLQGLVVRAQAMQEEVRQLEALRKAIEARIAS